MCVYISSWKEYLELSLEMGSLVSQHLSTPYYLTLFHLSIGICNSGLLSTGVSFSLHDNAWSNGQVGASIRPTAFLAKPCPAGFNLHKGILGTRNGLVSIPTISQLINILKISIPSLKLYLIRLSRLR